MTAFIYYGQGTSPLVLGPASDTGRIFRRIGLPALNDAGSGRDTARACEVSMEQLDLLEADLVLSIDDPSYPNAVVELEAMPLFKNLPAVREGRFVKVTDDATAIWAPSALSVPVTTRLLSQILA